MYKILTTSLFERNIRRLSKNFPRIKKDLLPLLEQLENEIFEGDLLQEIQALVYKVRVGSIDQKKGKRGGFRLIYYIDEIKETVYLAAIYAKAHQANITPEQYHKIKDFINS